MRACDYGAPTIRERFFLVARRDGLPIVWPDPTHGDPSSVEVRSGRLLPWRTAAECIDFNLPAASIFERKRPLVDNTLRRVAKGLWRHVLTSSKPFLVGAGGPTYSGKPVSLDGPMGTLTTENHRALAAPVLAPFIGEHANSSNQRNMPADAPLRTLCAQVKGGHFSVVAPVLSMLRGTSEAHLNAHNITDPVSTVSAGGTHHALVFACLEQANGGFYEGDGRAADQPVSTITASGSNQRLVAAYCVKYYSSGGQWQGLADPMHTLPTKARMGLVQTVQVPAPMLDDELRGKAKACAELLHKYLPEHFGDAADMVLVQQSGQWWVLVDITLRMLKARELYRAQSFPESYIIHEVPNPELLFLNGIQAASPLDVPRIPLTNEAQVRMCGNSVAPLQARATVAANFMHEQELAAYAAA
jgi:DNA (cytosine-5)-methyltransferase 1